MTRGHSYASRIMTESAIQRYPSVPTGRDAPVSGTAGVSD